MLKTVTLILPILLPSWRFFKTVDPSPRIEWMLADGAGQWHRYRPRPQRVTVGAMLWRLLWNPRRNEALYMVSCTERLHLDADPHSAKQIAARLAREILASEATQVGTSFRYRVVFVQRVGAQMVADIAFTSDLLRLSEDALC